MPAEPVLIAARPHLFRAAGFQAEAPAGMSVAEMLGAAAENRQVAVSINGALLERAWWSRVRPKAGATLEVVLVPAGGGNKVLRTVLTLAVVAASIYTLGAATPALGALGAGFAAAGVSLVGNLAINALVPPPSPKVHAGADSFDRLSAITGTSNQANPYGAVPVVLGQMRYFPPHAALPFTELSGDQQYIRLLLALGYGDPDISDIRIGDTPLDQFTGVETEIGADPKLYSNDVAEVAVGATLNGEGDQVVRTSAANADELGFDLVFAQGLFGVNDKGDTLKASVKFNVEYRETGTSTWQTATAAYVPGKSYSSAAISDESVDIKVSSAARKTLRVGMRWKVETGQYDVRLTRLASDYADASAHGKFGDCQWATLRTIRHTVPATVPGKFLAMRIQASDQINGSVSQVNCIARQKLPVYNTADQRYETANTANPAWAYRWVLTGPANPHPVGSDRLDEQALIDWADACDAQGFEFNGVIDSATTIFAMLRDLAAAGRASFGLSEGRYSVVRDLAQTTPIQYFSPRNSWGFSASKSYAARPDALRVQFINPEANWQQDEIVVYDDGYDTSNATRFESLQLRGVTDPAQAWRHGRYYLAVHRLRARTYSFSVDWENLVVTRGDLIMRADDVLRFGLGYGRIKSTTANSAGDVTAVTTDQALTVDATQSYGMRIRTADGSGVLVDVSAPAGEDVSEFTLASPQTGVAPGDLFLFGHAGGAEARAMLVNKIEPGPDLTAKLTCIDYAPAVYAADTGAPPAFISEITGQPFCEAPPPPDITAVLSGSAQTHIDDAGVKRPRINVGLRSGWRSKYIQAP